MTFPSVTVRLVIEHPKTTHHLKDFGKYLLTFPDVRFRESLSGEWSKIPDRSEIRFTFRQRTSNLMGDVGRKALDLIPGHDLHWEMKLEGGDPRQMTYYLSTTEKAVTETPTSGSLYCTAEGAGEW